MDDELRLEGKAAQAVGTWVVHARKQLHQWRQHHLASATGRSPGTISKVETGKGGVSLSTITSIEDALKVERGTLMRVAAGEDIDPESVRLRNDVGQSARQLSQLVQMVRDLQDEVAELKRRAQNGAGRSPGEEPPSRG